MAKRELSAAEIRELLSEITERLAGRGLTIRICVVGGAALALTVYGDRERRGTLDIDASFRMDERVAAEIAEMALEHDLPDDWFNNDAKLGFPPNGFPDGTPLYRRDGVTVEMAPPDLLLAVKLRAARWGRDDEDIALLVRECDIRTNDEAKTVLDRYYLGEEALKPDAIDMLNLTRDQLTIRTARPPIDLPAIEPRPAVLEEPDEPPNNTTPVQAPARTRCTGRNDDGSWCDHQAETGTDRCRRHPH